MAKILLIDIETAPNMGFFWGLWKENIGLNQILKRGFIMCAAMKWLDDDNLYYFENRNDDDSEVIRNINLFLDEADYVIAHNALRFDIPYIKARAIVNNFPPPSPYKVIDTLRIAKREFRFSSNKLENLAIELKVPNLKSSHGKFAGFELWLECMKGNKKAWKEMRKYNIQDVLVLEDVYKRLRPYATIHPNITVNDDIEVMRCPKCGSVELIKQGFYTTNVGKYQRYSCKSCGGWSSERYTCNTVQKRKSMLASR